MSSPSSRLLTTALLASAASLAQADVLTFDDLPGSLPTFFTANYRGFQFGTNNAQTSGWFYSTQTDTTYKPHSGTTYIATTPFSGGASEDSQRITSATPFVFSGAWFSGATDSFAYKLYSGNTLVYTSGLATALPGVSSFVASGYGGLVTSVVISGKQGNFALDDFTYAFATAVPEPASAALMSAGFAALALTIARRRRHGA